MSSLTFIKSPMLKRSFHIIIALLLVFTTTASVWSHLIANDDDPIELNSETEKDAEKGEKETEKEFDDWGNALASDASQIVPEIYCGLQKVGSSSFGPSDQAPKRLYLLYQHLKLDC